MKEGNFNTLPISELVQLNHDCGIEFIIADGRVILANYPSEEKENH